VHGSHQPQHWSAGPASTVATACSPTTTIPNLWCYNSATHPVVKVASRHHLVPVNGFQGREFNRRLLLARGGELEVGTRGQTDGAGSMAPARRWPRPVRRGGGLHRRRLGSRLAAGRLGRSRQAEVRSGSADHTGHGRSHRPGSGRMAAAGVARSAALRQTNPVPARSQGAFRGAIRRRWGARGPLAVVPLPAADPSAPAGADDPGRRHGS
jgi:hypothetical protein